MFEFDASKLIIIGIVALIVIGPKDLPGVLRQLGQAVGKMRRMASEFQGQFMEAIREADVADAKADIEKLGQSAKIDVPFNPLADIRTEIQGAIDKALPSPAAIAAPEEIMKPLPLAGPAVDSLGVLGEEEPSAAPLATVEPLAIADAPQDEDAAPHAAGAQTQGIDAQMQALAAALKAEIETPAAANPHFEDAAQPPGEPAAPHDKV